MPNDIIENPQSIKELQSILSNNPGIVIFRFTATWCGPCKRIAPYIKEAVSILPNHVQFVNIDIDECIDVYRIFKQTRQVPGVPTCLAFRKGNTTYAPDFSVVGADSTNLAHFFNMCNK